MSPSSSLQKGDIVFDTARFPTAGTDVEKLGKLKPAFIKDRNRHRRNTSGINDGASFMVLASEDAVKKYGLKPLCEVVAYGQGGVDPRVMGLGPTPPSIRP